MWVVCRDYTTYLNQIGYTTEETTDNHEPSWRSVPNSLIVIIQDGGGRHIEFRNSQYRGRVRATTARWLSGFMHL